MNLLEGGWPFLAHELTGLAASLIGVPLTLALFIAALMLIRIPWAGLEWVLDQAASVVSSHLSHRR